ncbi:MAG TPA: AAA family ATPase, partial [Actinomycetota bacterium]|nr:AAA family ATPase [Actinomycetota bacterium]
MPGQICASCRHDNPADSRFCGECGSRLGAGPSCPGCGTPYAAGQRFCNECGRSLTAQPAPASYTPPHLAQKILTSRSAMVGERKQVTVLFTDIKGFTRLAQEVGIEELHRIMDDFFALALQSVSRYEGTINQYAGDGIMALFGAPIAHEDHASRACFAALHLAEALDRYARDLRRDKGLSFTVRMGVNSGEVVVGAIGDDLRLDYTAAGNTVILARRMEELADPGSIFVTSETAALVEGYVGLDDLGHFNIRDVPRPVHAYKLSAGGDVRTKLQRARARGFSRFVGREAEVEDLESALERAVEGSGQVVGVVGEPGVGKSRLCYEVVQRARARGLKIIEAQAIPHGKAVPFAPVLELLRGYFGIADLDDPVAARQKIAGSLLLLGERFREVLPLVFDFLGVPDPNLPAPHAPGEVRHRQLSGVLGQLVRARSDRGPAVVLLEDVHWLDPGSETFIEQLVDAVPGTRTLLLVNFRPDLYSAPWLRHQVQLRPLGPEAIVQMLIDRLGNDPSLDGLPEHIQVRSGGNPFFAEELVQALVDSEALVGSWGSYKLVAPVDHTALPATVQAVLSARIDRLEERERWVLRAASVIGRKFSESVLRNICDLDDHELASSLDILRRAEFVHERGPGDFSFRHRLTQEVAYRSQLTEPRARLHAAAARTIEDLEPDRLDELAALLAYHWTEAGEPALAARWQTRAAAWAGVNDPEASLRHWWAAREQMSAIPEGQERDRLALDSCVGILNSGSRLGVSVEQSAQLLEEGRLLAERLGDTRSLAQLLLVYARARGQAGAVEEALEHSLAAATLAEQTGLRGLRMAAAVNLSIWHWQMGRLDESVQAADSALVRVPSDLRIGSEHLGSSPYIWQVMQRGRVLPWLGRFAEAERELDRAVGLATEHEEMEILCWAH